MLDEDLRDLEGPAILSRQFLLIEIPGNSLEEDWRLIYKPALYCNSFFN